LLNLKGYYTAANGMIYANEEQGREAKIVYGTTAAF
jgi:hypothetical protein